MINEGVARLAHAPLTGHHVPVLKFACADAVTAPF